MSGPKGELGESLGPWRADTLPLFALLAISTAALALLKLASEVVEGDTMAFDAAFLTWLRHATSGNSAFEAGLKQVMFDLAALGDNATLLILVAILTGYLLCARKALTALFLATAVASGALATTILKLIFDRARPEVMAHLVPVGSAGVPSGHAMNAAVVYLTLAAIVTRCTELHGVRLYALAVGISLTIGIGFSRLYLGGHWPSDVLAGWIFGAGWAGSWSLFALFVQRCVQVALIHDRDP